MVGPNTDDDDDGLLSTLIIGGSSALVVIALLLIFSLCFFCLCFFAIISLCFVFFRPSRGKKKKERKKSHYLEKELFGDDSDGEAPQFEVNKEFFKIRKEDLRLIKQLGSGGGGKVYLASWNGSDVAYKAFSIRSCGSDDTDFTEFEREVAIMGSISHPNILRFFGACLHKQRVGIVMEYCSNKDLYLYIHHNQKKKDNEQQQQQQYTKEETEEEEEEEEEETFPMKERMRMALGIARGMSYLHERNIIHRDLKSANVLLDSSLIPKIIDFGISRVISRDLTNSVGMTKMIGTSYYMAPEVTLGNDYNEKCDVFSFAIVFWELVHLSTQPYGETRKIQFNVEVKVATNTEFRPKIDETKSGCRKWMSKLMKRMWDNDPSERPSFEEIKEILQKNAIQNENKEEKNDCNSNLFQ